MGRVDVDAGSGSDFDPATQNAAAGKDKCVSDPLLVDDCQSEITIERRRGNRLPIGLAVRLMPCFHTRPVQIEKKVFQAFGELVTARQNRQAPRLRSAPPRRRAHSRRGYARSAAATFRCPNNKAVGMASSPLVHRFPHIRISQLVSGDPSVAHLDVAALDCSPSNAMRRFFLPTLARMRGVCVVECFAINALRVLRQMRAH